jgi:hypothetical protein
MTRSMSPTAEHGLGDRQLPAAYVAVAPVNHAAIVAGF